MLNIVKPDQGTVTMFGKDFLQNEKSCKQNIGVVFGGIDFYPLKKLSAITAVTRTFYQEWDQQNTRTTFGSSLWMKTKYSNHFLME